MIKFKSLGGIIPTRATVGSGGFDLRSMQHAELKPGAKMLIGSGIAANIPRGWGGQIWPRSGLASRYGLDRLAGFVDSDYRGEIMISMINHGQDVIQIKEGERIAQLVVVPVMLDSCVVEELDDTERGNGGFGSTGRK